MGIRRQPQTPRTPERKPHYQIRAHPEFAKYLTSLRTSNLSDEKKLAELIDNALVILMERATAGEAVPRDRWPRTRKYEGLPNLYRYRLDRIHRMMYFIWKDQNQFVVNIIEAMDHTMYNRIFGYD